MNEFDDATYVSPNGEGEIRPGWDIGGNANGGYLLSILANAMRQASHTADPISLSAHFLAPGSPGPVQATTEVVKAGRRFTTVTGSLRSGTRELVRALGTFGDVSAEASDVLYDTTRPPDVPPYEECVERPASNGSVAVALTGRVSVRLHPDQLGYTVGAKNGVAELTGWFAFRDGRPLDTLSLLLACDAFPPSVFNIDLPPGWVPTVTLNVQIRERPAPGPVQCRFTTRHVANAMFEEDGEVWDSRGRLVALSRQLALIARAS